MTHRHSRPLVNLFSLALLLVAMGCEPATLGDLDASVAADAQADAFDSSADADVADAAAPDARVSEAGPADSSAPIADATAPDATAPDATAPDATLPPSPDADFCETAGVIAMEAEDFSEQLGFVRVPRDDAAAGAAMQAGDIGVLSFHIHVETAGTWYFWPRTLAPDSESNGMHVEVDLVRMTAPAGSPHAGTDDIFLRKSGTQWFWDPSWQGAGSGAGAISGPVTFQLAAGLHNFSILKRFAERPHIDRIVLTTSGTPPTDLGPASTPCR